MWQLWPSCPYRTSLLRWRRAVKSLLVEIAEEAEQEIVRIL